MKKTEKIEIRISQEDKAKLADMAAREGKTVSDLLRELGGRYVAANRSTRTRPRFGTASMAGMGLAGVIGAGLALATPNVIAGAVSQYDLSFEMLPTEGHSLARSTHAVDPDRTPAYYVFPIRDDAIPGLTLRVDFRESQTPKGSVLLVVCSRADVSCGQITEYVLRYDTPAGGQADLELGSGHSLAVAIRPKR